MQYISTYDPKLSQLYFLELCLLWLYSNCQKWIRENKEKYNIRDLEPKDKIMISPITTILDNHAEHLYEVGFKTMNFKVLPNDLHHVLDYEPLKSIHLWKSIVLSKWEPTSSEWQFYWMWLSISCLQSVWTFSHLNFNQRGRYSLLKILEKITQLVHFVKPTFVTIPNWRVMF